MEPLPNIISIGYGRHLFDTKNPERVRMELCAAETSGLHMIIFTHRTDRLVSIIGAHNLTLHPTNSRCKLLMPLDAFLLARRIIKSQSQNFLVTTQDPFETGLIGYFLKLFYKTRLIVQEHGDVFSTPHFKRESVGNLCRYYCGLWVLYRADLVRVVSERTRINLLKRGIAPVTKLPVSIAVANFVTAEPDPVIKNMFGPDTFVFLSVARLVKQKNIPLMIEAFRLAYEHNSRLRLLLVGSGPLEADIRLMQLTAFPDHTNFDCPVHILPWSDQVPRLMKAADAYLLSSDYEGWARVLIEALAAQLPVVTTDVGCAREVVQDGVHGIVTPVGDAPALAAAIEKMAGDSIYYDAIKLTLARLPLADIPGTDLENYGKVWVHSLSVT